MMNVRHTQKIETQKPWRVGWFTQKNEISKQKVNSIHSNAFIWMFIYTSNPHTMLIQLKLKNERWKYKCFWCTEMKTRKKSQRKRVRDFCKSHPELQKTFLVFIYLFVYIYFSWVFRIFSCLVSDYWANLFKYLPKNSSRSCSTFILIITVVCHRQIESIIRFFGCLLIIFFLCLYSFITYL